MIAEATETNDGAATLHVPLNGPPVTVTPTLTHECSVAGIRTMALPPGRVELNMVSDLTLINLASPFVSNVVRVGGTDYSEHPTERGGLAWYPAGADLELRGINAHWEALIEIEPDRLDVLVGEATGRHPPTREFVPWTLDPLAAAPARLLIDHLRQSTIDPLFVEGLTLAVIARGLHLATGGMRPPSTRGYDRRIRRAIDHIEANIARTLSVAEIAAVAAMSPSHFARSFKSATGEAVWAFVVRRRTERAREMLARTDLPQAIVAHRCGFSDAGHLRRMLRRRP